MISNATAIVFNSSPFTIGRVYIPSLNWSLCLKSKPMILSHRCRLGFLLQPPNSSPCLHYHSPFYPTPTLFSPNTTRVISMHISLQWAMLHLNMIQIYEYNKVISLLKNIPSVFRINWNSFIAWPFLFFNVSAILSCVYFLSRPCYAASLWTPFFLFLEFSSLWFAYCTLITL